MGTVTIRNLPDDVHDRLRLRAARNRRSVEAEARALLAEGVAAATERKPGAWLGSMRGEFETSNGWSDADKAVEQMFEQALEPHASDVSAKPK